jgi:hypothetical protein
MNMLSRAPDYIGTEDDSDRDPESHSAPHPSLAALNDVEAWNDRKLKKLAIDL